jgi:hypothetical protein
MKDLELQLKQAAERLDAAIKRELELRKPKDSKNILAPLVDPFDLSKDGKKAIKEEFTNALESDGVIRADAYTDCIQILTDKTGI